MKWSIPAKTFLLGEYAAVAEASAIIITTAPYFELSLVPQEGLGGIHPESPAGLWWSKKNHPKAGLSWSDPYNVCGGLGASSAQFLASYLASCTMDNKTPVLDDLLHAYYQCSWSGIGLRPSGYDVIAQSQRGCVYINKYKRIIQSYDWPFTDLSFFLIHTGKKLATHHHLQDTPLPSQVDFLSGLVDEAQNAFETAHSEQLIETINDYHQMLKELNLVAQHSLDFINELKALPELLAVKGCGALGADVLLLITSRQDALTMKNKLKEQNWLIIATEANLAQPDKSSNIKIRL